VTVIQDSAPAYTGPDTWQAIRLKFELLMNASSSEVSHLSPDSDVTFLPMEAIGVNGELDVSRTRKLEDVRAGYTYLADGDIALAKITPCFENGKCAIVTPLVNSVAFATTEVLPLRPRDGEDAKFFYYLLVSEPFRSAAEASMYGAGGQKRVPDSSVANHVAYLPAREVRRSIARFLDRETARIDALIDKQKKLIELLKEKRQALISQAVTKGLDPDVPMKDSGVEWFGRVPAHWKVVAFRFAYKVDNKHRTPIDRNTRAEMPGDFPYYGPTGVLDYISLYSLDGDYFLIGEDGDHFLKFRIKPMTVRIMGKVSVNNHAHVVSGGAFCTTDWGELSFECLDVAPWLIRQGVGRYKLRKEALPENLWAEK